MHSKLRILITGASGQLGQEFMTYFKSTEFEVLALTRTEVDFSCEADLDNLENRIISFKPNFLINCAAYTAVDLAL